MRRPYCGENLGDYPWAHTIVCTDTDSMSSVGEIYEYFDCECPECGKMFRWFENYVRVKDTVRRMEE